jgi:hypothetical protein
MNSVSYWSITKITKRAICTRAIVEQEEPRIDRTEAYSEPCSDMDMQVGLVHNLEPGNMYLGHNVRVHWCNTFDLWLYILGGAGNYRFFLGR